MSRVSPFLPSASQGSSTAPAFLRCRTLRPRSDPCSPCRNPNRLLRHERFETPSQAAKRLVKEFSAQGQKGLVSRVSPFLPSASQGSSTAPAFLRCRTLRPRSDPCSPCRNPNRLLRHERLRIPSQAAKRLVKEFSAQAKKDSCHESALFASPRRKAHQQRPPSCAVGPCDRVQIRVAHVVIPTDYYDMSALRPFLQAAKRLVKEFSKRKRQKGLVSRVSPFALRVARLINSARLLRCRTLRPRSDPCVAHVVIPTDYYDMSALRISSSR